MKKLGQHFLKNTAVLTTIINAIDLAHGDRIIEIGPGHGELTIPLLRVAKSLDATVTSIEKDHALIANLATLQKKEGPEHFIIKEGDALKLLSSIVNQLSTDTHYKIVGNIPYYITGKLLRVISELEHKPERVVLMIQKEVAERICAAAPDMNRLAASVQFWADATIIAHVPRKDFSPPPDVDSAVILLKTKTMNASETLYYRAVRGIFAQPRKTLLNNMEAMAKTTITKSEISDHLKKNSIDPESRPHDLTIQQIIAIANDPLWG